MVIFLFERYQFVLRGISNLMGRGLDGTITYALKENVSCYKKLPCNCIILYLSQLLMFTLPFIVVDVKEKISVVLD